MTFVRSKEIPPRSGNYYDYEVQNYRDKGHVKQKVIQYLGRSGTTHPALIGGSGMVASHSTDSPIPNAQPVLKVVCKHCQGQHTRKYGTGNGTQYYYCDDCKRKFAGTDALAHGKVSPTHIVNALNEFYNGLSFHEIQHNIEDKTDSDISHTAIMNWVNKYTPEAIKQTKDLHPKVGDTWIADETFIRIDKRKPTDTKFVNPYNKSRKAKWVVYWDIIDADTRFLLASICATSRSAGEAKELMLKASERAGKLPKVVVTDGLKSYVDGMELAYGADSTHRITSPFEVRNDNNLIERFQGTIKDRTKVMRALKNGDTLKRFMDGWLVNYNFFKPHMSLNGKTPAEEAGLKYDCHNWVNVGGY